MALLTLSDIGKIYVSEGNVSVGIRGVNLSFERGEFVAITGKSGSGKTTLLNVIGGTDTYEEGELTVMGNTTSHYLQSDFEEYREKYISFIYQDYNIIESFTVLQNVELALMSIEDKKQRRARALELIRKVGLEAHIRHKGSQLSGGQKQRTVIARALAKDSPIILADEPTGNLDSTTSKDIMALLREVSRDKLLIVVTHDFDEVADYATRHIRVFDGEIEFDHLLKDPTRVEKNDEIQTVIASKSRKALTKRSVLDGVLLGKTIFFAKPKLTAFICALMIFGMLGIFFMTSICSSLFLQLVDNSMFTHIDGRVVLVKRSGEIISEEELNLLADQHGANGLLHYDLLLDEEYSDIYITLPESDDYDLHKLNVMPSVNESFGDKIIGRYPTAANEILLYLPISCRPAFGKNDIETKQVKIYDTDFDVVGVKYYYDNNITPRCLFTEEGFRVATAAYYISWMSNFDTSVSIFLEDGALLEKIEILRLSPSFDLERGQIYIDDDNFNNNVYIGKETYTDTDFFFNMSAVYSHYDYLSGWRNAYFEKDYVKSDFTNVRPDDISDIDDYNREPIAYINYEDLCVIAESVLQHSYRQASLFFENDKEANVVKYDLRDAGYIAVSSDTSYTASASEAIIVVVVAFAMLVLWGVTIVFFAWFVNLCSSRSMGAFKNDMAIMRSMGIRSVVIKVGIYMRMLVSIIPSIVVLGFVAITIFTVPKFNELFTYLYWWQYLAIVIGMCLLSIYSTKKQIQNLFNESVKKSLRGGVGK